MKTVILRNRCLKLFFTLLYAGKRIHVGYCEDVVQVVGFDWIQLFLQGHLHQVLNKKGFEFERTEKIPFHAKVGNLFHYSHSSKCRTQVIKFLNICINCLSNAWESIDFSLIL